MKNINVNVNRPPTNIPLGRQGENLATCVTFDCTGLVQLYGDGTAELLHELKDGTIYPVSVTQDGASVSWTVSASDTATVGAGRAELRWYVGDTLAKSAKFRTSVSSALADSTTETPPEPQKSWVDKVLQAAQEIKDGAISDEKLAEAIAQALAEAKASGEFDGEPGKDGADGGYYAPSVDDDGNLTWTASAEDMPTVPGTNIKGPQGEAGSAGATAEQVAQIEKNTQDISSLSEDATQLKSDLGDVKESTKDLTATSNEDNKDKLLVTDGQGNVIAQIDSDGVHSTDFITPNGSVTDYNNLKNKPNSTGGNPDVISEYDDTLYITDGQGNVIFKADKNGIAGLNISGSSVSPYKGMKLISIGDSLSAHDKWQKWLVEWLGMTFDNDENINGKDGHAPMAKGGTAIMPNSVDSIYIRALDAHYYNPGIIFVYAGQNDVPYFGSSENVVEANFGTINDLPYLKDVPYTELPQEEWSDYTSFYEGRPTMYSRSMGLIQRLSESCPNAIIKILTPMQMWTSNNAQSVGRFAMVDMWKQIGSKYGIDVIDLWNESGVCSYNGSAYYPNTGNVHPSDNGYKMGVALSIYQKL